MSKHESVELDKIELITIVDLLDQIIAQTEFDRKINKYVIKEIFIELDRDDYITVLDVAYKLFQTINKH